MNENGEGGEGKTAVISLNDERDPISNNEAAEKIKGVLESLADSSQRLGLDEDAAVKMREEIRRKREK